MEALEYGKTYKVRNKSYFENSKKFIKEENGYRNIEDHLLINYRMIEEYKEVTIGDIIDIKRLRYRSLNKPYEWVWTSWMFENNKRLEVE